MSHGTGGSLSSHYDAALARAGCVVAAMTHTGGNYRDQSRAADDHILLSPDYAQAVKGALPQPPEYRVVAGADHFDFLAPCSQALAAAAPIICQEHGGFDRVAFHQAFNAEIVRFFQQALR